MFSDIIEAFERSFQELTTNRFIFISFIVGAIVFIDYVTGFSFYYNLNNQLEALQRLQEISKEGLGEEQRIRELYRSILSSIEERQDPLFPMYVPLLEYLPIWLAKGLSGIYVYAISIPTVILISDDEIQISGVIIGVLIIISIFFLVSFSMPTLGSVEFHFFVFTGLQIITMFLAAKYGRQSRAVDA